MLRASLLVLLAAAFALSGCATSNPSDAGDDFAVTGVSPTGAGVGSTVKLTGTGLGDGTRASQVMFFTTPAMTINYWTDTEISVVVPNGIPEWSFFDVFVRTGRADSDGAQFLGLPEGWTRITDNGSDDCHNISWDYGEEIYFSSTRDEPTNFDVWKTYADGVPTTQITFGAGTEDHPTVTQTDIAYAEQHDGQFDIRVSAGAGYAWATLDEYPDYWPDFNPYAGGDYELAFTKGVWNEVDEVVEYYIYGYPGYRPCEPITLSGGGDFQPSWSPDGLEIAFMRASSIHKVEVATHLVTQLTSGFSDAYPDWGLDGRIIWIRAQDELWIGNGDGTNQQMFLDPPGFVMSAAWSPGQTRIAMILLLQGEYNIFIYELP